MFSPFFQQTPMNGCIRAFVMIPKPRDNMMGTQVEYNPEEAYDRDQHSLEQLIHKLDLVQESTT